MVPLYQNNIVMKLLYIKEAKETVVTPLDFSNTYTQQKRKHYS